MTALSFPIVASTPPSVATTASAGSLHPSKAAGVSIHRELARHLRIYGGPSLETRRDSAEATAWLSGCLSIIAMLYAALLGGWGWLTASSVMGGLGLVAGVSFAAAVLVRDKNERRICEAEAAALAAVTAAVSA